MFARKPKSPSGFVITGLGSPATEGSENPDSAENMVFITIVDEKKKKKGGLLSTFLGIDENDSKESAITLDRISRMIRIIENVPPTDSINFILHTMGGCSLAVNMLTRAILNHPGKVRAFIPQYAFSAGTMIALAADEIYMTTNASLGPIDLQLSGLPLNSIIESLKTGSDNQLGYVSAFMKSYIERVAGDDDRMIKKLLKNKFGDNYNDEILAKFCLTHNHSYPMDVTELREIGLEIRDIKATWRNVDQFLECNLVVSEIKPDPEAEPPAKAEAEPPAKAKAKKAEAPAKADEIEEKA